jgi:hypothetical protein
MHTVKTYATHAFTGPLLVYDFETLTPGASTAVPLTAAKLTVAGKQKAVRVFITCETVNCRYRLDGVDPTASVGHLLYADGTLEVEGVDNLKNLRIIAVSDTAAVSVTYSRYEG